ncbi:MAG: ATP-binding cassette domain-containing protein, partial [Candidatus Hodarchaeota archaeon]
MKNEADKSNLNQNSLYDIEIFNLCKNYKLKHNIIVNALRNVNLKVKKGEILGLLGPNGAGKTTMVSILSTLVQPTSGTAKILGYDVIKQSYLVKINIGVMFGSEMIYHRLTGYRNLKYYSRLYGISNYKERIKELAERFNLSDWIDQYVDKYSRGMQL